jgi:hypothetical protein
MGVNGRSIQNRVNLEEIIRSAAVRMRRKFAMHQDRSIEQDLQQSAWEYVLRHPDHPARYLKRDIHNAMMDEIAHWLWGCKRGQKPRRLTMQVDYEAVAHQLEIIGWLASFDTERLAMVHECLRRLHEEQPKRGRRANLSALAALIESGQGTTPSEILRKYKVNYWQISRARQRGRKIFQECL